MKVVKRLLTPGGIAASLYLMLVPVAAKAIELLPPCTESGNCTVGDLVSVFTNFAELLLGIIGSVALGFFVYGGFVWILSGGSQEQVKKGKDILRNAVIGIAIILTSGIIVRFTTQALTGGRSTIPVVGESCTKDPVTEDTVSAGIYVSIPAGFLEDAGEKKPVPQQIKCVPKDKRGIKKGDWCGELNKIYKQRGRSEKFTCININTEGAFGCVRGICINAPADFACCLKRTD